MVCTYCGSETHVFNSRHQKRTNSVWRRRKCLNCGSAFSTTEQVDYEKSWVVQYPDGSLLPFLRDKLFVSLYKSLQHRPSAATDAIGLTSTVINSLQKTVVDGSTTTTAIATLSQETLGRFDRPAATMYTAYHAGPLTD